MKIELTREQLPVLITDSVTTLISDSGITRYRIEALQWLIYDKTDTPYQEFPKGIYLEQFIWKLENYWWIFVVSVILSVLIALISVIWQTLRAARTNPAIELKKE